MPRKKKTALKGRDPAYTSDFSQPLPTNKLVVEETPKPVVSKPVTESAKTLAASPSPKPTVKPEISSATQAPTKPAPAAKPKSEPPTQGSGDKREIALSAAVKLDQQKQLDALETKGTPAKIAITMAGRRAVEQFEPKPEYVEKQDVQRMPMRQGYKSTKRIDASLLDALRNKHDPHRLSSDSAMMRGQFEPLFWSCLDAVIKELNSKD